MSSSSQAARGSPSRGWPTLPGLSSQRPLAEIEPQPVLRLPAAGLAGAAVLGEAGEEEGDVRVADQRQPLRLDLHAGVGLLDREHVLPDGVAGGGVEEADPLALQGRVELAQELERRLADLLPGPLDRLRGGLREGVDVELAEHGEVVVADQAGVAALPDQLGAGVRVGPVADHVSQAPDLLDTALPGAGQHRLEGGQVGVYVA